MKPFIADGKTKGAIKHTVWSDVNLSAQNVHAKWFFGIVAVDKDAGTVSDSFSCPHCNTSLTKRGMERVRVTKYDDAIKNTIRQAKQVPVLIDYTVGGSDTPDKMSYRKRNGAYEEYAVCLVKCLHTRNGWDAACRKDSRDRIVIHSIHALSSLFESLIESNCSLRKIVPSH